MSLPSLVRISVFSILYFFSVVVFIGYSCCCITYLGVVVSGSLPSVVRDNRKRSKNMLTLWTTLWFPDKHEKKEKTSKRERERERKRVKEREHAHKNCLCTLGDVLITSDYLYYFMCSRSVFLFLNFFKYFLKHGLAFAISMRKYSLCLKIEIFMIFFSLIHINLLIFREILRNKQGLK